MAKIILVTGTPGVGKTELARRIAKETRSDYLSISRLVKKEKLHTGFDKSAQSYIIDERKVRDRLKRYLTDRPSETLIVDTHHVREFLPWKSEMVALVLRLDPIILHKRLKARGWNRAKIWENVEAEMIDIGLYESSKLLGECRVYEIDTTGKTPSKVLGEALRIVSHGRKWHAGRTNWLRKYDPVELSRRF